jgi:hypothetical protein
VKISLIGYGYWGRNIARTLKELDIKMETIFDLDKNQINEAKKLYNFKKYNSLEDILKISDIVFIATPPSTHYEIAKKALNFDTHNNYFLISIYLENKMIAGIWLILANTKTAHTFYIAQDYEYTELQPLSCIVKYIIEFLKSKKFKYLNFGISTENMGEIINKGLFEFKESFGGFGVSRYYFRREI